MSSRGSGAIPVLTPLEVGRAQRLGVVGLQDMIVVVERYSIAPATTIETMQSSSPTAAQLVDVAGGSYT